jgi:hypothetical protein
MQPRSLKKDGIGSEKVRLLQQFQTTYCRQTPNGKSPMKTASFGFTTLAVVAAGVSAWIAAPLPLSAAATVTPAFRSTYDKPPQNVLDVLHAPAPAQPVLSPSRDKVLLVTWVQYPSITRVAEPFLRLAGNRVEPRNRSNHSTPGGYGIAPCACRRMPV